MRSSMGATFRSSTYSSSMKVVVSNSGVDAAGGGGEGLMRGSARQSMARSPADRNAGPSALEGRPPFVSGGTHHTIAPLGVDIQASLTEKRPVGTPSPKPRLSLTRQPTPHVLPSIGTAETTATAPHQDAPTTQRRSMVASPPASPLARSGSSFKIFKAKSASPNGNHT